MAKFSSSFDTKSRYGEQPNIVVMPSLFRETMEMIFESYELFELHDSIDKSFVPPHIRSLVSGEMSRITMRLTSVMAWLMARKAVASGQASLEEQIINYKLEGDEYCLANNQMLDALLPDYLTDLLGRSLMLYQRVWRLDQQSRPAQLELQIS